jgi:fibronectin type 3 domain-containing protein
MSGAGNGVDYNTITSPVTIPAGSTYVDIILTPINDSTYEGNESAVMTLSANAAYQIGSPSSATITIQDDDLQPSPTPPSPPANVSASDGTYLDRVEVTWTASPGATSYIVYRAASLAALAKKTVLGTIPGILFNDTTAIAGRTYYYWVRASNAYGTSGFSAYNAGKRSNGIPSPPSNVSATDGTYLDRVEVTWAASPDATLYTVYRAASLGALAKKVVLGTTSGTSLNDTTAIPGRTYYYWVRASNAYGTSGFSVYDAGKRSNGIPSPPANVSASDGTYTDRVEVTWAASSGATSYKSIVPVARCFGKSCPVRHPNIV